MIDLEKRRRIMSRSIKLGHCICNPKDPCPCDVFRQKNVCLCAGEREEDADEPVLLTRLVENAGCASKIGQEDLKRALEGLPRITDPAVLVSADTCDDAGVYKLDDTRALVQSVDVFTPVVDDPHLFGQIAAANSVSDIYAMGGTPLTALSIVAFPVETVSLRLLNRMLQGGIEKLAEAGTAVIGGHSIKDREVKFGFAVTGLVDPRRIITNAAARPGDVLILTKPLGTGVLSFASQLGRARPEWLEAAGRSMAALNRTAAEIMVEAGVVCATDITGFGLMGHLAEMATQSGVRVEVRLPAVPVLEGVRECLEFAARAVEKGSAIREEDEVILYDPQTSGGLLMCVAESGAGRVLDRLRNAGVEGATVVGRVVERSEGAIRLRA
jgi:selenide,water dikinase